MYIIKDKIEKPDREIATSTLSDDMGRYGAMSQEIKPFIPGFHMVVIPKDDAKTILEKALGILKKEVEIRKRMVSGEALFDILGLGLFEPVGCR